MPNFSNLPAKYSSRKAILLLILCLIILVSFFSIGLINTNFSPTTPTQSAKASTSWIVGQYADGKYYCQTIDQQSTYQDTNAQSIFNRIITSMGLTIYVLKGSYANAAVHLTNGSRLIQDADAVGLTVNPASGANCSYQNWATESTRFYVNGQLVIQVNMLTATSRAINWNTDLNQTLQSLVYQYLSSIKDAPLDGELADLVSRNRNFNWQKVWDDLFLNQTTHESISYSFHVFIDPEISNLYRVRSQNGSILFTSRDAAAAINAALNALPYNGGGVSLGEGIFNCYSAIGPLSTSQGFVTLAGAGFSTLLELTVDLGEKSDFISLLDLPFGSGHHTIKDLSIGSSFSNKVVRYVVNGAKETTMYNVWIEGWNAEALARVVSAASVDRCVFWNNTRVGGVGLLAENDEITGAVTSGSITNSFFGYMAVDSSAIKINGVPFTISSNWAEGGILGKFITVQKTPEVRIIGNYISSCDCGVLLWGSQYCTISGNTFTASGTGAGIGANNTKCTIFMTSIEPFVPMDNVISGNIFTNYGDFKPKYLIYEDNIAHNLITDNILNDYGTSAWCLGQSQPKNNYINGKPTDLTVPFSNKSDGDTVTFSLAGIPTTVQITLEDNKGVISGYLAKSSTSVTLSLKDNSGNPVTGQSGSVTLTFRP